MRPVNRMLLDVSIEDIENKYNARYVIDACLKNIDGQWMEFPVAIFYTEKAHPQGSNYFAIYWHSANLMISNGFSAVQGEFNGILFEDDELIHSCYRHDYFEYRDAVVDGGRDYFRTSRCPKGARPIKFKVVGPDLVLCVV